MKYIYAAIAAAALLASAAEAQTWNETGDEEYGRARGLISATTPVQNQSVQSYKNDLFIGYRCGTLVSLTVQYKLDDGTVIDSQSVPCDTTQRSVSRTAPLLFDLVALSPTTAVSTTAGGASATVIWGKRLD